MIDPTPEQIAAVREYCDRVCNSYGCKYPASFCLGDGCRPDVEGGLAELAKRQDKAVIG